MRTCILAILVGLSACATAPVKGAAPDVPPSASAAAAEYRLRVSHPKSLGIEALRDFLGASAPRLDTLKKCDQDYQTERVLARSPEQLYSTVPQYVVSDPMAYHWCFYAKLLELEENLSKGHLPAELTIEEKQALILDRYPFFITIGRIFMADFNDPKYLEFAVFNYRRLSQAYFGRSLDLSSKIKGELELPETGLEPYAAPH